MFLQREAIERGGRDRPGLIDRALDGGERLGEPVVFGSRLSLGGKIFFDPRHRIEHHAGVRIAVTLGVLAEKPAAPRGLHEGFADRLIILLARQRGAGGDRG